MGAKHKEVELYDSFIKRKSKRAKKVAYLEVVKQVEQEKSKKTFHLKDLKQIFPLTENQDKAFESYRRGTDCIALVGLPGTGKTYLALFFALQSVLDPDQPQEKVVIVRSVQQGMDMGFLPGTIEEKSEPFKQVYKDICADLFPHKKAFENLEKLGLIQFETTSFLRGKTFSNSVVILDEAQNEGQVGVESTITRMGKNSRFLFVGDLAQCDFNGSSGFNPVLNTISKMTGTTVVKFGIDDIVRSGLVKRYLTAKFKE